MGVPVAKTIKSPLKPTEGSTVSSTRTTTDKNRAFLVYVSLGCCLLLGCVLINVALVGTVQTSVNKQLRDGKLAMDPTAMNVFLLTWAYNLLMALITIPNIYMGLNCVGEVLGGIRRFSSGTRIITYFSYHIVYHVCLLLITLLASSAAWNALMPGTNSDLIQNFAFWAVIFPGCTMFGAAFLTWDIKRLTENIELCERQAKHEILAMKRREIANMV